MPETSQTLDRGLRVLELIAASPAGVGVSELAARAGLGRTVVLRLVATLVEHRLVRRSDDGVLRVAPGVLGLAVNVQPMLRDAARPVLGRLASELDATTHLSVVDGDHTVCIEVAEPAGLPFHLAYRLGTRLPLEAKGYGRALLDARNDDWQPVATRGEVVPGVYGVSAAVPHLPGVEAAIGVIAVHPLDVRAVSTRLRSAVREIGDAFALGSRHG